MPNSLLKRLVGKAKDTLAHRGFRRYAGNTGWLFGGQMLRMGINLFVAVAVARYLGPADFGLFNYVTSVVALITVISGLGLQNIAKRDMVEDPERRDEILGTCFILNAFVSVLCYGLTLAVVALGTKSVEMLALFSLLGGVIILQPFNFIEQWFQSQVRSKLSVLSTSIALLLFSGLKVWAILDGGTLVTFAYLGILEMATVTALKIYFYRKHYGLLSSWHFQKESAIKLLKQSWPLIFSGLAVVVYMRIDTVMLMALVGEQATGEYSAATRISAVWYFMPQILAASLFPAIVNAKKNSKSIYLNRLQRYLNLNSLLAYFIIVPVVLFSSDIINILYGTEYVNSAEILKIHAWSALFVFTGVARNQYLVVESYFKFSLLATTLGCFLNVLLNYYLIPLYSGYGAAIATLISYSISAYFSSLFIERKTSIFSMQTTSMLLPLKSIKN